MCDTRVTLSNDGSVLKCASAEVRLFLYSCACTAGYIKAVFGRIFLGHLPNNLHPVITGPFVLKGADFISKMQV